MISTYTLVKRLQIRRKGQRSRLLGIGLISIGALFLAFLFIYPNFKPIGDVFSAPLVSRTNVDFNAVGDPEAPIKIEEYSDFQCPYCRKFFENTEAQLLERFVANGTVYFVYHSFGDFIATGQAAERLTCGIINLGNDYFINQTMKWRVYRPPSPGICWKN